MYKKQKMANIWIFNIIVNKCLLYVAIKIKYNGLLEMSCFNVHQKIKLTIWE